MNCLKSLLVISIFGLAGSAYAQGEAPAQIELGTSLDTFDKNYISNWHSNYVEGEKKLGERYTMYGALRETERYAKKDTELQAGLYYPLAQRWTLLMEGNASPSHNVLATWSALGQAQYAMENGWGAHLGLRHTEYDTAVINILQLTAERYWLDYRAAYTHSVSALTYAGYASSDRAQLSWYYDDRSWLGIGVSQGSEIENVGPQSILSTAVQYTGLNGRHWLNRDWALSYEAYVNVQGSLYTKNGFRLGLRHQF